MTGVPTPAEAFFSPYALHLVGQYASKRGISISELLMVSAWEAMLHEDNPDHKITASDLDFAREKYGHPSLGPFLQSVARKNKSLALQSKQ